MPRRNGSVAVEDMPLLRAKNSVDSASVNQAVGRIAQLRGVSANTVYRWLRRGEQRHSAIGRIPQETTESYWDAITSQAQAIVLGIGVAKGRDKKQVVSLYLSARILENLDRISVALTPLLRVKLKRPDVISVLAAATMGAKAVSDAIVEDPSVWQGRLLKQLRKWSHDTEEEFDKHYWIWKQEELEWRASHQKEVWAIESPPGPFDPANIRWAVGAGTKHMQEACYRVLDYAKAMKEAIPPEQWEWYAAHLIESWGWKAAFATVEEEGGLITGAEGWERAKEFYDYGWILTTRWATPQWEYGPDVAHRLVNRRIRNKN